VLDVRQSIASSSMNEFVQMPITCVSVYSLRSQHQTNHQSIISVKRSLRCVVSRSVLLGMRGQMLKASPLPWFGALHEPWNWWRKLLQLMGIALLCWMPYRLAYECRQAMKTSWPYEN
jgi:hypothetical protein